MKSVFIPASAAALGVLMFAAPYAARAQDANRDTVMTQTDVGSVVDRLASKTHAFRDEFDHAVDRTMIDGTRIEDNARRRADDLHNAAAKLGDVFHDKKDKNNPAVRDQADRTIAAASELNRVMDDHRFTDKLQRDWAMLRSDLNALAAVYRLTPLQGAR